MPDAKADAKADAKPDARDFVPLGIEALDDVERLHQLSLSTFTDRTLVKPEKRGFFESILTRRGTILGYRHQGELIAYGVLMHELPDGDRTWEVLGLTERTPLIKLAGAAVHPEWRGRGLQRTAIRARLDRLRAAGGHYGFATAAPGNVASWSNLLSEGFRVVALVTAYGTLLRYLLSWSDQPLRRMAPPEWRGWRETDWQATRLAEGWQGIAWREGPQGREIAFARDAA